MFWSLDSWVLQIGSLHYVYASPSYTCGFSLLPSYHILLPHSMLSLRFILLLSLCLSYVCSVPPPHAHHHYLLLPPHHSAFTCHLHFFHMPDDDVRSWLPYASCCVTPTFNARVAICNTLWRLMRAFTRLVHSNTRLHCRLLLVHHMLLLPHLFNLVIACSCYIFFLATFLSTSSHTLLHCHSILSYRYHCIAICRTAYRTANTCLSHSGSATRA